MPPSPPAPARWFYDGMLMCSMACVHAAGDRSNCGAGCTCIGYAVKGRLLREHRVQMRVMDNVIRDHDLESSGGGGGEPFSGRNRQHRLLSRLGLRDG